MGYQARGQWVAYDEILYQEAEVLYHLCPGPADFPAEGSTVIWPGPTKSPIVSACLAQLLKPGDLFRHQPRHTGGTRLSGFHQLSDRSARFTHQTPVTRLRQNVANWQHSDLTVCCCRGPVSRGLIVRNCCGELPQAPSELNNKEHRPSRSPTCSPDSRPQAGGQSVGLPASFAAAGEVFAHGPQIVEPMG